jgi:hypothetical protein
MTLKYTQWTQYTPHGNKIYHQPPLQDPPKFTQIGIFVCKSGNLASKFAHDFNEIHFPVLQLNIASIFRPQPQPQRQSCSRLERF